MSGDRITLEVKERGAAERGSRNVRRLRRQGLVPGVLYGKGDARAILIGERDLRAALTGPSGLHGIVDVLIEGSATPHHAILKDHQQHPVRGNVTHVDFHEVRLDQPIQTSVSVQLIGDSIGVRAGGQIQHVGYDVRIEALPTHVPDHVVVDVTDLDIGGVLRIEDLEPIDGVTFLDDPQTVLATCTQPRGMDLEEEEAVEGEGEPGAEAAEQAAGEGDAESAPEE